MALLDNVESPARESLPLAELTRQWLFFSLDGDTWLEESVTGTHVGAARQQVLLQRQRNLGGTLCPHVSSNVISLPLAAPVFD